MRVVTLCLLVRLSGVDGECQASFTLTTGLDAEKGQQLEVRTLNEERDDFVETLSSTRNGGKSHELGMFLDANSVVQVTHKCQNQRATV